MDKIPLIEKNYGTISRQDDFCLFSIPKRYSENMANVGFGFNILVISRRNLGVTTLINSLFEAPVLSQDRPEDLSTFVNELIEGSVKLKLSVSTYHGFCNETIIEFIEKQWIDYYDEYQDVSGSSEDRRVHVCIYIIPDIETISEREIRMLKYIAEKCVIVPVITKADIYTEEELENQILKAVKFLQESKIPIFRSSRYRVSQDIFETLEKDCGKKTQIKKEIISSVSSPEKIVSEDILRTIASEKTHDIDGKIVYGRKYPWGFIDIENTKYSDFKLLRTILIEGIYRDFIEALDEKFYAKFLSDSNSKTLNQLDSRKFMSWREKFEKALDHKYKELLKKHKKEQEECKSPAVDLKYMDLKSDPLSCRDLEKPLAEASLSNYDIPSSTESLSSDEDDTPSRHGDIVDVNIENILDSRSSTEEPRHGDQ